MTHPFITVKNLSKEFDGVKVLDNISFEIPEEILWG